MKRPRPPFVLTLGAVGLLACNDKSTPPQDPTAQVAVTAPPPSADPTVEAPPSADAEVAEPDAGASATSPEAEGQDAAVSTKPVRMRDFPKLLNPKDAQGRTIKKGHGSSCFVELPYPPLKQGETRYPGTPPPSKAIACPAEMQHPSYANCQGGTLHASGDGAECICFVMGNPPPPPRRVDCPD